MIVTLTANPSHDRTVVLNEALRPGEVQRAAGTTNQAGGKGTNISRGCLAAGVPTTAVVPATEDDPYVRELVTAGMRCRAVPHPGSLRVNFTLTDPEGTTTKINTPGPEITGPVRDAVAAALLSEATEADWVVLAGSLPPGIEPGWYAELVAALGDTGAKVAVDTSDAPLRALVDRLGTAAPHLLKPNGEELASLTGADPDAVEADPLVAAAAAQRLVDSGVEAVLATLGGNGAVLVTADGAWLATPPPTTVVSTVGAGDSSLCGYLLADLRGESPGVRLAHAVAYGSAAASLPGTTIPAPDQTRPDLVDVRAITPVPAT
ncbi:MAG: 1-phosphofructokinase [Nocardioides sp.]|nr:1-phosphofructokinase [Nocardioides sp.]